MMTNLMNTIVSNMITTGMNLVANVMNWKCYEWDYNCNGYNRKCNEYNGKCNVYDCKCSEYEGTSYSDHLALSLSLHEDEFPFSENGKFWLTANICLASIYTSYNFDLQQYILYNKL